jgi:hypothetical protein
MVGGTCRWSQGKAAGGWETRMTDEKCSENAEDIAAIQSRWKAMICCLVAGLGAIALGLRAITLGAMMFGACASDAAVRGAV